MKDSGSLSFAADIAPMFTTMDVDHMKKAMDLSDRDSVLQHGDAIYESVTAGTMPPPGSGEPRWSDEMCATFKQWKDQGGLP